MSGHAGAALSGVVPLCRTDLAVAGRLSTLGLVDSLASLIVRQHLHDLSARSSAHLMELASEGDRWRLRAFTSSLVELPPAVPVEQCWTWLVDPSSSPAVRTCVATLLLAAQPERRTLILDHWYGAGGVAGDDALLADAIVQADPSRAVAELARWVDRCDVPGELRSVNSFTAMLHDRELASAAPAFVHLADAPDGAPAGSYERQTFRETRVAAATIALRGGSDLAKRSLLAGCDGPEGDEPAFSPWLVAASALGLQLPSSAWQGLARRAAASDDEVADPARHLLYASSAPARRQALTSPRSIGSSALRAALLGASVALDAEVVPVVRTIANDRSLDPTVRMPALDALAELGPDDHLVQEVVDRIGAAWSEPRGLLGTQQDREVGWKYQLGSLLGLLQRLAADGLVTDDEPVVDLCATLLCDDDEGWSSARADHQRSAAAVLGALATPRSIEALRWLGSQRRGDIDAGALAARELARCAASDPTAVRSLVELIAEGRSSRDQRAGVAALAKLASDGDATAKQALVRLVDDRSLADEVRGDARRGAGAAGALMAVPLDDELTSLVGGAGDLEARLRAAASLERAARPTASALRPGGRRRVALPDGAAGPPALDGGTGGHAAGAHDLPSVRDGRGARGAAASEQRRSTWQPPSL